MVYLLGIDNYQNKITKDKKYHAIKNGRGIKLDNGSIHGRDRSLRNISLNNQSLVKFVEENTEEELFWRDVEK